MIAALHARCAPGVWWQTAAVSEVLGYDVLTIPTIRSRYFAPEAVATVDPVTRLWVAPDLVTVGVMWVLAADVVAHVEATAP